MKSKLILEIAKNEQYLIDSRELFSIKFSTSDKFKNDKILLKNDDYYIILDGIILNKKQLLTENNSSNWTELIVELYEKLGRDFFKTLKGSYFGFVFNKKENTWDIFNDHIGTKQLFYFENENSFFISNDYTDLAKYLKSKQIKVSLNENAAYLILTYGFVFEDVTITNEIKKLLVGHSIKIDNAKLSTSKFFQLSNNPISVSEDEAIELLDQKFRESVKLAFEKDKEYDYEHVACLSGGLDSRMTVYVAHELGYTKQLNLTFSQSDYLDETIAKKIARDLKHEWIFKYLDNGTFLKNLEEITTLTSGNVLYYGLSHAQSLFSKLNFQTLGMIHSGQLGDVVIGSYSNEVSCHKPYKFGDGAFSKKLLHRIKGFDFKEEYENEEIFKMYIRGFYGINQGLASSMNVTETHSPFYDVDFLKFAFSIPIKYRNNHKLYIKWMKKKYPQACEYVWEREKVPVKYNFWIKIKGHKIPLSQVFNRILGKIGFVKYGSNTKNHMNPLQYWYESNPELKAWIDQYFKENINELNDYHNLKADCEKLFNSNEWTGKVQVLSLLSAIKLLNS